MISYLDNSYSNTSVVVGDFVKNYKVGERVSLPFLNWKLQIKDNPGLYKGNEYFVQFNDFDGTVSGYRGINVRSYDKGGSIITLGMTGTNKARMVEYLNATVKMLIKRQLDSKNRICHQHHSIYRQHAGGYGVAIERNDQRVEIVPKRQKHLRHRGGRFQVFGTKFLRFDVKKDEITRKMAYYNSLKAYLKNSVDYSSCRLLGGRD